LPVLHSPRDTLSAVHADYLYESYHVTAVFLAYIDEILD